MRGRFRVTNKMRIIIRNDPVNVMAIETAKKEMRNTKLSCPILGVTEEIIARSPSTG